MGMRLVVAAVVDVRRCWTVLLLLLRLLVVRMVVVD
jgi:hypothetical protein